MTRREAHGLAGRYIPNIWGSLRTAWVNGFIGYPERGVACTQETPPQPSCGGGARRIGVNTTGRSNIKERRRELDYSGFRRIQFWTTKIFKDFHGRKIAPVENTADLAGSTLSWLLMRNLESRIFGFHPTRILDG